MANVTFINPNMIRVTTTLTKEQINLAKEVDASLLTLENEDKEVMFRIDCGRSASVSRFGVCFTEVNNALLATVEFDINKASSKFIAKSIKEDLETVETNVTNFLGDIDAIEIETI